MKIIVWACICPVCRCPFSAYLVDCQNPQRDEIAHDKRSLLCNVCEQAFVSALYHALHKEGVDSRGLALSCLNLSALRKEAQRAGEPGKEASVGTDKPCGLFGHMHGMQNQGRDKGIPHRVSGVLESPHETLRGPTVLPPDPADGNGVM